MPDTPNSGVDSPQPSASSLDPRALMRDLKAFTTPSTGRSLWELAITLTPFVLTTFAILWAVSAGYWGAVFLTPLAGLLLLRLFVIQHDCGHGSFFDNDAGNDWTGRALGVLTFTPYDCWRKSHAIHHSNTGKLDGRGYGDVDTLTLREFQEMSALGRFGYRLYRHPIVLFGIGPAYLFLLRHRLPIGLMTKGWNYWVSAMATNAALLAILAGIAWAFGIGTTALVLLPILLTAASTGVWLFYIQHQFEDAHWDWRENWKFQEAALYGSSHLALPQPFRWFTAEIGVHHVHHLASRVPFYRLQAVLEAHPALKDMNRFTARETIKAVSLVLWDESARKLVSFRDARKLMQAA